MTALLALLGVLAGPPLTPAPPMDCGYLPVWHRPTTTEAVYPNDAGCGMAPQTPDAWQTVTEIDVVRITTGRRHTRVEVVFLNKDLQRVLPIGRTVRYDMQFTLKKKGTIVLKADSHRDGVFMLDLPPGKRTGECDTHLFFYFQNTPNITDKPISRWLDDWLLKC